MNERIGELLVKQNLLSAEQLKKTRTMKDLGAATQADVYKAEVDHSNNRLAELRADRDLAVGKADLAAYLGLDPLGDVELADEDLAITRSSSIPPPGGSPCPPPTPATRSAA